MAKAEIEITIEFKWWFRYIFKPAITLFLWLGFRPSQDWIARVVDKAVILKNNSSRVL